MTLSGAPPVAHRYKQRPNRRVRSSKGQVFVVLSFFLGHNTGIWRVGPTMNRMGINAPINPSAKFEQRNAVTNVMPCFHVQ